MKTYILRGPQAVQPQKAQCLEPSDPQTETLVERIVRAVERGPALYIGLDVHTDSIAASLAPADSNEVRRYGLIGGTHDDVLRLARNLQAAHPGLTLQFVSEARPHGYPLCRCLRAHHYDCMITPPSKIPVHPGSLCLGRGCPHWGVNSGGLNDQERVFTSAWARAAGVQVAAGRREGPPPEERLFRGTCVWKEGWP